MVKTSTKYTEEKRKELMNKKKLKEMTKTKKNEHPRFTAEILNLPNNNWKMSTHKRSHPV